jgi:hypothetical protein
MFAVLLYCLGGACFLWLRDPQNRPMLLGSKWVPIAAISAAIALNLEAVADPIKYSAGTFLLALAGMDAPGSPLGPPFLNRTPD